MIHPIRVLIISGGGERKATLEELFAQDDRWDVTWTAGIASRSLRGRQSCLEHLHQAGLLPSEEWEIISQVPPSEIWETMRQRIPLSSLNEEEDRNRPKEHYSSEFWNKAKTVNRGRSVLGCLLAHLVAMKQFVEGDFDVLLEDNVRWTKDAVDRMADLCQSEDVRTKRGDLLYYGWLGSKVNLEWLFQHFIAKSDEAVVPFPTTQDIERTVGLNQSDKQHPGGTPLWGMYAYWISKQGYEAIMEVLRRDIGSMLWKGKRMRYYSVKPADKVFPRSLQKHNLDVRIVTRPLFFRAPMLYSRIHPQWDALFCESTTVQLNGGGLDWSWLLLTAREMKVVDSYKETGEWKRLENEEPQNED
jgi:GR25 family glycosyltransferase involved in LPS biosynthesis